jgi:hypothetical protein
MEGTAWGLPGTVEMRKYIEMLVRYRRGNLTADSERGPNVAFRRSGDFVAHLNTRNSVWSLLCRVCMCLHVHPMPLNSLRITEILSRDSPVYRWLYSMFRTARSSAPSKAHSSQQQ